MSPAEIENLLKPSLLLLQPAIAWYKLLLLPQLQPLAAVLAPFFNRGLESTSCLSHHGEIELSPVIVDTMRGMQTLHLAPWLVVLRERQKHQPLSCLAELPTALAFSQEESRITAKHLAEILAHPTWDENLIKKGRRAWRSHCRLGIPSKCLIKNVRSMLYALDLLYCERGSKNTSLICIKSTRLKD